MELIRFIIPKLIRASKTPPTIYQIFLPVSLISAPFDASIIYMMPL
jgi:hypothetical protein